MENVFKYYEIAAPEDSYRVTLILCHKITASKLRALS